MRKCSVVRPPGVRTKNLACARGHLTGRLLGGLAARPATFATPFGREGGVTPARGGGGGEARESWE